MHISIRKVTIKNMGYHFNTVWDSEATNVIFLQVYPISFKPLFMYSIDGKFSGLYTLSTNNFYWIFFK